MKIRISADCARCYQTRNVREPARPRARIKSKMLDMAIRAAREIYAIAFARSVRCAECLRSCSHCTAEATAVGRRRRERNGNGSNCNGNQSD